MWPPSDESTSELRLSSNQAGAQIDRRGGERPAAAPAAEPPPRAGCRGGAAGVVGLEPVMVELQEGVGGGAQSPFAAAGGSAAALEAFGRAVELDLAEHRLDRDLP